MEVEKIDRFIIDNRKYLPEEKLAFLKQKLCETDENRFAVVCSVKFKDPTKFLLTSIFLGIFGVDRFALGDTGMGVLKLLTLGGCGMLALYDCFTVREKVRQLNYNNLMLAL